MAVIYFLVVALLVLFGGIVLLYVKLKVISAYTDIALAAYKLAAKNEAKADILESTHRLALKNERTVKALEDWAQALTASANAPSVGDFEEKLKGIAGIGEDFTADLEKHGFNADPIAEPDDLV